LDEAPFSENPAIREAYHSFLLEDFDAAIRILQQLSDDWPGNPAFRNDLAVCHYLAGNRRRSRELLLQAAEARGPRSAPAINLAYLFDPRRFPEPTDRLNGCAYRLSEERADLSRFLVSIIILEYNNPRLTRQCLQSIHDTQGGIPYEVILIDNSDASPHPDPTPSEGIRNFHYYRSAVNLGFAGGCNQGAALARGTHLYFVNNDTLFQAGCMEELARVLLSDDTAGIAGSKLLYEDGTIQHAGVIFDLYHNNPVHRGRGHPADDPFLNLPLKLQAVTGASLMIRRDLFERLGGFYEAYRTGFEDVDLCFRAAREGYGVIYNPGSVLIHLESKSPGRFRHEQNNLDLFRQRWPHRPDPDELALLSRKDLFLLAFTEHPRKGRRRAQLFRLVHFLERTHPEVLSGIPLFVLEKVKRLRIQKACTVLLRELVRHRRTKEATILYRYVRTRYCWHRKYIQRMRSMMLTGAGEAPNLTG
jgi:GT2 family glycosyltransferase